MSVEIKADIRHWLRELDKKYFFVMLGFCGDGLFSADQLEADEHSDGLWTTAEYMAGAWELSNGRWFWLVTSFSAFQSAARTHQCGGVLGAGFSWSHQASYALQTGMDENILH